MIKVGNWYCDKIVFLTLIVLGGWHDKPCDAKFSGKCPSLHNNNTALIKQIAQFDIVLVMTNTLSFT